MQKIITDSNELEDHQLLYLFEEFTDRAREEYRKGELDLAVEDINIANIIANQGPYFKPIGSFDELFGIK